MKIQVERNADCEAVVTVEVDAPRVEEAKRKAARQISEKTNIPGFRKGKAPYHVVLTNFGDEALLEEALDTLGSDVYREMLDAEKLEPSAIGKMESIESKDPLTIKFRVPLKPEVSLGEYRNQRLAFEEPVVPDEDVERAMEELRLTQSILEPVNRPAQKGDVLSGFVTSLIVHPDGKKEPMTFEGDENPMDLDLDENLGGRYPGAGTAFEGITEGETRKTELTYPDSFPIAKLQGLKAELTVRCDGVKVRHIPEWTDEIAKTVSGKETVAELRQDVRTRMEKQVRDEKEQTYAEGLLDKMVEGATIKYPPALLEEEVEEEIEDLGRRLEERKSSLEVYLRTIPEGLAGLKTRLEPNVKQKLVRNLFLSELIKKEALEPGSDEIDKEFDEYLKQSEANGEKRIKRNAKNDEFIKHILSSNILSARVTKRIAEIGQGKAPELPAS